MRYSDEIPYEKRRYWYFTLHGTGPGTIPKDLKVLEYRDGRNKKYIGVIIRDKIYYEAGKVDYRSIIEDYVFNNNAEVL